MADVHKIYKDHVKFLIHANNCLVLNYKNYLYQRINGNFPKTTWECIRDECSVIVKTVNGMFDEAECVKNHSHFPVPLDEIEVIKTKMRIKHWVKTEFNLTPRQIHMEERMMLKLNDDQDAHLKLESYTSVRANLYKYRQSTFPKAPKTREDIILTEMRKMTVDKSEEFLLVDDGNQERILVIHIMFSCFSNIEIISVQQIEKFHDYMLNTWVHDTDAIYDRRIWNHFQNNGPRTTNNAKGWNHKINQQAKSRLGFFQFVHFLQKIQLDIDATKFELISESPSKQLRKYKKINEQINVAKQNYESGNVPILSYLDSVSIALKLD